MGVKFKLDLSVFIIKIRSILDIKLNSLLLTWLHTIANIFQLWGLNIPILVCQGFIWIGKAVNTLRVPSYYLITVSKKYCTLLECKIRNGNWWIVNVRHTCLGIPLKLLTFQSIDLKLISFFYLYFIRFIFIAVDPIITLYNYFQTRTFHK